MAGRDTSAEARLSQTAPWRRLSFVAEVRRVTRAGRLAAVDARSAGARASRIVRMPVDRADLERDLQSGRSCARRFLSVPSRQSERRHAEILPRLLHAASFVTVTCRTSHTH